MEIRSSAFGNGEMIPVKHTCDGADFSPSLEWSAAPAGTKSFALICDDPDAPMGTWVHWVIYDIPPSTTLLAEGIKREKELAKWSMGVGICASSIFVFLSIKILYILHKH